MYAHVSSQPAWQLHDKCQCSLLMAHQHVICYLNALQMLKMPRCKCDRAEDKNVDVKLMLFSYNKIQITNIRDDSKNKFI